MRRRFLSCDWGTSSFRLRLVERAERGPVILDEVRTGDGVAAVHARWSRASAGRDETFRRALLAGVQALAAKTALQGVDRIVISGMAGSTLGWRDVPYARLPIALDGSALSRVEAGAVDLGGAEAGVLLLGGIATADDIARGEEVELLGLLASPACRPLGAACLAILPGTHSKHLRVRGGELVGFRTFLTGELYAVLIEHSVLGHSVDPGAALDEESFVDGVRAVLAAGLAGALFSVRARQVLDGAAAGPNASYLSGIVIGAEAAELARSANDALPILLGAAGPLAGRYRLALDASGAGGRVHAVPPGEVELAAVRGHDEILRALEAAA